MESPSYNAFSTFLEYAQVFLPPLLALIVSLVYFVASPRSDSVARRGVVCAHGVAIALIYCGALAVWWSGHSNPALGVPFMLLLIVPLAGIVFSLTAFHGKRAVHWLQLVNVGVLGWTYFLGGMAVTGRWI